MQPEPYASIIIIVKNGMPDFEIIMEKISIQQTDWSFEIVVVDSGSKDRTLEVAERFGCRIFTIPPEAFNHGDTRNLGARNARGKYLVYLVADAIPYDEHWLSALVTAAESEGVAGACSRKIPRPEHDLLVRVNTENWPSFGTKRLVKSYPADWQSRSPEEIYTLALYDDVSSCMKKSVWEDFPYANVHCEDVEWSHRVMTAGYQIVFEPKSVVYHSHQRPFIPEFKRSYVFNRQLYRIFGFRPIKSLFKVIKSYLWGIKHTFLIIIKSKESLRERLGLFLKALRFSPMIFSLYWGTHADEWMKKYKWYSAIDRNLSKSVQ